MYLPDCAHTSFVFAATMTPKILFVLLTFAIVFVNGAKILGIFQRPSKSHHILGGILFKALAKRGHHVTMVSPFRLESPVKNFEEIIVTGLHKFNEENDVMKKHIELQNASMFEKMDYMGKTMNSVNEKFFNDSAVKDLLSSNRTFDLVIQIWTGNSAYLGIAHHFKASVIVFSTIGSTFITNSITANPAPYSYVPSMFPVFPNEMTFWQRLGNSLSHIIFSLLFYFNSEPKEELVRQKYFPNAPHVTELVSNVSMVLLNSHYSIESPRPYVPSMVQVGGLHVEEPKELTGDLKEFMDSATDGVIFFSLGSNVKMSDLPKDKLDGIVATFAKVALKVLWKFEKDDVPNLPPNVKIGKWLPQRDILGHSNTRLFVTHGGLLSTIESIYHGVPMVGIPVFGDQNSNVDDAVNKEYAVKVAFQDLSEKTLTEAINKVLSNPIYLENAQWRSRVLKDQPLKPIDTAVFWIEYVLRHKGAHHLKTSALKLKWYQYYLLDVFAFLGVIVLLFSMISYAFLYALFKLFKKTFTKLKNIISKTVSVEKKNK